MRAAGAALTWAAIGGLATRAPWHSVALAPGATGIDVSGAGLDEGQVALAAFLMAAFLAGFTLLAAGPLLGRAIALCGLVAAAAVGRYAWRMHDARETIAASAGHAFGSGGGGSLRAGAILTAVAAIAVIVAAMWGRRKGAPAKGSRSSSS
jgi:hypothetical protein